MAKSAHLDSLFQDFIRQGPAGCACGLAKDGKTLYEGYFGLADIDSGRPVTADTVFRLYSMTKVIICTAAMMLYERGKFLLSDPLYEYFPDWRDHIIATENPDGSIVTEKAKGPMLVRHAFTMAVGLPNPSGSSIIAKEMAKVRGEFMKEYGAGKFDLQTDIKAMSRVPIAFEPGAHFLYGYGHDLVAGLIEVASGRKLGDFLREEIFEPLGMTSTGYRYFGNMRENMVSMYERSADGTMTKVPGPQDILHEPDSILERGGAGLFSNVRDYLAFTQMLACGGMHQGQQLIGRKTIDLMRQNQLNEQQLEDFGGLYNAGYGYGLGVRTMMSTAKGGANTSLGEFGWTGGLGTWTAIDPSEGASAVYMHQMRPNMEAVFHLRARSAMFGLI